MNQVSFQNWNLHGAHDEETDTTHVLFCMDASFHVSGYVNYKDKRMMRLKTLHTGYHIALAVCARVFTVQCA